MYFFLFSLNVNNYFRIIHKLAVEYEKKINMIFSISLYKSLYIYINIVLSC